MKSTTKLLHTLRALALAGSAATLVAQGTGSALKPAALLTAKAVAKSPASASASAPTPAAATPSTLLSQPVAGAMLNVQAATATNVLHVLVGQSLILHDVNPLRRIYVGNPGILQTFTSGPEEVIVTARAAGVSTLVVWDTQNTTMMYTVHADVDTSALRDSLHAAFPNETIVATGNEDHVMLTGSVPTLDIADGAAKMAGLYVKEVVNSIQIVPIHGKQVQLKLTVAEVDRSKLEQFGINIAKVMGSSIGTVTTGQFPSQITQSAATAGTTTTAATTATASVSNALSFFLYNFHHGIGVSAQDLESANLLQILAEPTLTTMSGKTARFLSGGEFPIPIVQGGTGNSTAVSIQFKQYGVKVEFMPIVAADGTIKLTITPEVSTLDYTNAVTLSGFTVPALATRRSETEIELRDGQSFMLSGLLNHTTADSLQKIPGIADIPIIGQIFRSKSLNHGVSELVILCTATVVDPLDKSKDVVPALPNFPVAPLEVPRFDKNVKSFEKQYPAAH